MRRPWTDGREELLELTKTVKWHAGCSSSSRSTCASRRLVYLVFDIHIHDRETSRKLVIETRSESTKKIKSVFCSSVQLKGHWIVHIPSTSPPAILNREFRNRPQWMGRSLASQPRLRTVPTSPDLLRNRQPQGCMRLYPRKLNIYQIDMRAGLPVCGLPQPAPTTNTRRQGLISQRFRYQD